MISLAADPEPGGTPGEARGTRALPNTRYGLIWGQELEGERKSREGREWELNQGAGDGVGAVPGAVRVCDDGLRADAGGVEPAG